MNVVDQVLCELAVRGSTFRWLPLERQPMNITFSLDAIWEILASLHSRVECSHTSTLTPTSSSLPDMYPLLERESHVCCGIHAHVNAGRSQGRILSVLLSALLP